MREERRERRKSGRDGEKTGGKEEGGGVNIMIIDIQHKDHPLFDEFKYYLNICISDSCQRT